MVLSLDTTWSAEAAKTSRRHQPFLSEFARVAALTILPVLILAGAVIAILGAQERASVLDSLQRRAAAAAVSIDRLFDRQVAQLTTLAGSHALEMSDFASFYGEAQRALAAQPDWLTILLMDIASGQQIINLLRPFGTPLPKVSNALGAMEIVRTGRPVIYADPNGRGVVPGQPLYGVRVPVQRDGKVIYGLSAALKPEALDSLLQLLDLPPKWSPRILNRDGVIVRCANCGAKIVGMSGVPDVVAHVKAGRSGLVNAAIPEGTDSFIAVARAPTSGWSVALAVPTAALRALWLHRLWIVGLAGLVCAATALAALAWIIWRRRFLHDVLEKQVQERTAALERRLAERNVLLREIHHRVKNNLQMMASMIRIVSPQASRDPQAVLQDITRRIVTLGQAYNQVSALDDLYRIDLAEYLRTIGAQTEAMQKDRAIKLRLDLKPTQANIDTALPVGLITGELIANAFKHAFPDGRKGEIVVRLNARRGIGVVTVQDNGIGMIIDSGAGAQGLKLAQALANQVDGRLSAKTGRAGGVKFRLVFKRPPPRVRAARQWRRCGRLAPPCDAPA